MDNRMRTVLLRDARQAEADARTEALLLEGLASGGDVPLTREFWTELKAEAREIATKHASRKKRALRES